MKVVGAVHGSGYGDVARQLIIAGANVNFQDHVDKCGVLAKAVQGGHEQLANDLLQCGADLWRRDNAGRTPPPCGCWGGAHGDLVCSFAHRGRKGRATRNAIHLLH